MLTTSYFQEIIKERLIRLIKRCCQLLVISYQSIYKWLITDYLQIPLILISFCVLLFSCQNNARDTIIHIPEKEVLKEKLVLHPNKGLVFHLEQPFSGYATSYYPNAVMSERVGYWLGKKQGVYQKWFKDGRLSFEANYQEGKKHGTSKTWWRNGALRSASIHEMGITNGIQKQWYQNGQLFKLMRIVDGKEEGLQQSWRDNGKIYNNYEAKNGRIFGLKRANLCYELEDEIVQYARD